MSRWKTNLESQKPSEQIQSSLSLLESASVEGLSEQNLEEYSRLLKVLKVLAVRFSRIDAELFTHNTWGNLSNHLAEVQTQIRGFGQNRNITHLQNANNAVDQFLNILRPLDSEAGSEEFKAISDANTIYQQKIFEEFQRVKSRGDEVKGQLDTLSSAITQSKARLDENNQTIQQQKARLDQSIAEFQKQFSEAQEKRTKEFADTSKKNSDEFLKQAKAFDTQFAESTVQRKKEYENFFEDARKQSNAHLDFLQKREAEVDKIFGAIGSTAFAGNFKTTADNEASAANLWRWIALALMAGMIAVGAYAFYFSIQHEIDWKIFAFRLGTVIVLAAPAVYAANESSKHRERERLNRKVHLELASIDAYLVLLPETERNKIKGNLAEKFFGVPQLTEKQGQVTEKDLFGALSAALNNLTKGH